MNIITDPLFYLLAIPAILALGLGKGGFAGVGMISTRLLAGFASTIIQVGAPPYQVHILPQKLDKFTLIGTTIIFFALVNVMKLVPYFALGHFSPRTLATSVVLLPFAVAANFLGLWLAGRTPTELFYWITYLLMFLISLALIWQGGSAIL